MGAGPDHFSFHSIRKYLSRFGEMRFRGMPDGPAASDGPDPHFVALPPVTPPGTTFAFTIDKNRNLCLNTGPGLCCDRGEIVGESGVGNHSGGGENRSGEVCCKISRSCFIYDKNKSFVLGVDPRNMEIWEVPRGRIGASISADRATRLKNRNGIENISFSIRPAEFVGIYGGSGSGKTMLIERILSPEYHAVGPVRKLLLNIYAYLGSRWAKLRGRYQGEILIDGVPPDRAIDGIAYLPQKVDLPGKLTCREIFELAAVDRGIERKSRIEKMIARVLSWCALDENVLGKKYGILSGGQKRRVSLAVSLLRENTRLLIADEPTTGLDISSELAVMHALRTISRHGITVVAVTHSIAACRLFDRVLILKKPPHKRVSRLVFNGLWEDASAKFPGLDDREILERYTAPEDPAGLDATENTPGDEGTIWPFEVTDKTAAEADEAKKTAGSRSAVLKRCLAVLLFIPRLLCRGFGRMGSVVLQIGKWIKTATLISLRNVRRLGYFTLLALICVIIIQFGASHVTFINANVMIITLMTLSGAWLCSIYACMCVEEQLEFYAWENFSGLSPWGFVAGMFTSMLVPAAVIALVFNCGMFFSVNDKNLAPLVIENSGSVFDKLKDAKVLSARCIKTIESEKSDKSAAVSVAAGRKSVFSSPLREIWQDLDADDLDGFMKGNPQTGIGYNLKKLGPCHRFLRALLTMIVICLFGCSLGMFWRTCFRDNIISIVAIVVSYILFLMFSRAFVSNSKELFGPIVFLFPTLESAQINLYDDLGVLIPALFSLGNISRFAVSGMVYSVFELHSGACGLGMKIFRALFAHEEVVLALFTVVLIAAMTFLYDLKTRNWRRISR